MYAYVYLYIDMHGHILCEFMYINTHILGIHKSLSMNVCIYLCVSIERHTSVYMYA